MAENSDEKVCSFDHTLLDTYYEARDDCIIEFNKHFDNVQYYSFARIVELLNVKEMTLEGCQKGKLRISELLDENEQLKKEKESWKTIACQELSKWSIFSNEVSILAETRDIDRFLEKYYDFCKDMVRKNE